MELDLTPQLEKLIREKVASGTYHSASEMVSEALRLLEERDWVRQKRLEELRAQIQVGIDQADAGQLSHLSMDEVIAEAKRRHDAQSQRESA